MPFPSGTPVVTLTGTVPSAAGGSGFTGRIVLTPSAVLTDATHKAVYPGGGPVDIVNGAFSVQLIPNDAAGILPVGWKWQVDLQPAGGQRVTFWTDIPTSAGPTVDLSTLVPTSAPEGSGQSLPPTGPAGGALSGAYPNPQLSAATIASFDSAGAAATAQAAAQAYTNTAAATKAPLLHAAQHAAAGNDPETPTAIGALPTAGGSITGDLSVAGRLTNAGFRLPSMFSPVRRPQWRQATTSFLMQSGHGFTVGGGGTASSNANDTTSGGFIRGTQAIRVTTAANGVQSQVRKLAGSAMDLTGKALRVTFKIDDVTHLNRLELLIGTSTFANFYRFLIHTHVAGVTNWVQSGEWITYTLSWADISASGGTYTVGANGAPSSRTGFTDLQFNCYDDAAGAVTYHLQSIEIIPDTTTVFPGGVASVTFDDSWASQYTLARPRMDINGQRATLYTIAEYIGLDSNHMAVADLRTLQDFSGWEIAGHAYSAAAHGMTNGFSDLTAAQVHDEFTRLKLWLASNGLTGNNFAYPKGHFEVTTDGVPVDQIAASYWATSRTIISENKESFPPAMPQRIRAMTGINDGTGLGGTTVASLTATGGPLDRCQNAGDWLILCFHEIVTTTPANSTQCTQTGFNTVMDALATRSIPVRPINEVISYYT